MLRASVLSNKISEKLKKRHFKAAIGTSQYDGPTEGSTDGPTDGRAERGSLVQRCVALKKN